MKIMVTGIGAIGGYLASVLTLNYPDDVTIIARRGRKDSILEKGLVLHSALLGEKVTHPKVTDDPASAGIQDVIFVCVKNYSLEAALKGISPCVGPETIVVPMLNGVDHTEVAKAILPKGTTFVDTVIYINSAADKDYSIHQLSKFAILFVGGEDKAAAETVFTLLNHEGFKTHLADDIQVEMWNKYITNCAYNVITAYYEKTIGEILNLPQGKEELHTLLMEAQKVGEAQGIALNPQEAETIYGRILKQKNKDVYSSLALDFMHKQQSELETFSGYIVRTGRKLGVDVTLSAKMYEALKKRSEAFIK
ncbi:MAG: ketopantoate reductase family protein [Acidaminococcus sp.]|jgi:2-dehydropantoate 2-reductase|nr:ketopantoate reductase family protein [Acidaminococcus sp.]MCI2113752.1 ketopantoate reductase family protein [Acidaminococcus sp.]MCI2115674.1 ketopantoate reductase family protein [Acidaminococcus sp.]